MTKAAVGNLEYRAIVICSAIHRRAEQVTVGIGNQAGQGWAPLLPLKLRRVVGV